MMTTLTVMHSCHASAMPDGRAALQQVRGGGRAGWTPTGGGWGRLVVGGLPLLVLLVRVWHPPCLYSKPPKPQICVLNQNPPIYVYLLPNAMDRAGCISTNTKRVRYYTK